jgi:hypothetical protein
MHKPRRRYGDTEGYTHAYTVRTLIAVSKHVTSAVFPLFAKYNVVQI